MPHLENKSLKNEVLIQIKIWIIIFFKSLYVYETMRKIMLSLTSWELILVRSLRINLLVFIDINISSVFYEQYPAKFVHHL